ncbi:Protein of unknown function DUF2196 [Mucilaginibacter paludis DSM 18603]|uniref:Repeat protein (TIGR03833 family) n=2 Tax=Mucilaginibacter TaxID=423349 RepID=H1Y0Q9_9SPHI|nr:Protein of unknown function DUF2196 [Mucilaginibacter paludis DSM 18603]
MRSLTQTLRGREGFKSLPYRGRFRGGLTNGCTMNGQNRADIYPGLLVDIILKKDQRSGKRTRGVVANLLTSAAYHSRGIKVRLEDGQVGRVAEIIEED